jgi:hypothetical protein
MLLQWAKLEKRLGDVSTRWGQKLRDPPKKLEKLADEVCDEVRRQFTGKTRTISYSPDLDGGFSKAIWPT